MPSPFSILQQMAFAEAHFLTAILAVEALTPTKQTERAKRFLIRAVTASDKAALNVNQGKYSGAAGQLRKAIRFGEEGAVPFLPEVLQN